MIFIWAGTKQKTLLRQDLSDYVSVLQNTLRMEQDKWYLPELPHHFWITQRARATLIIFLLEKIPILSKTCMRCILQVTLLPTKLDPKYIHAEVTDMRDNSSSTCNLSLPGTELHLKTKYLETTWCSGESARAVSKWNSLLQSQLAPTSLKQISEIAAISIVLYKTSSWQEIHY